MSESEETFSLWVWPLRQPQRKRFYKVTVQENYTRPSVTLSLKHETPSRVPKSQKPQKQICFEVVKVLISIPPDVELVLQVHKA